MAMKTLFSAGAVGLAMLVGACSAERTGPVGPGDAPAPNLDVVDPAVWATPLLRNKPLDRDQTASYVVGPNGGSFEMRGLGLKVTIPAHAVSAQTTITARAIAGSLVAYEFGPHGTTFAVPLEVQQALKGTNWYKLSTGTTLEAGYFADRGQLDHASSRALVNEFLPAAVDVSTSKLRFDVEHFSGYLVSSGRTKTTK